MSPFKIQILGQRCKLPEPERARAMPAAERYVLHFGLKKASDESNFTCIFTKKSTLKFNKLRDLVAHSKPTPAGEHSSCSPQSQVPTDPLYVAPSWKLPGGDRHDTPLEYVSEWQVFRMLDSLKRQPLD